MTPRLSRTNRRVLAALDGPRTATELEQVTGGTHMYDRLQLLERLGFVVRGGLRETKVHNRIPREWLRTEAGRTFLVCSSAPRLGPIVLDLLDSLAREPMTVLGLMDDTGRSRSSIEKVLARALDDLLVDRKRAVEAIRGQVPWVYSLTPAGRAALQAVR